MTGKSRFVGTRSILNALSDVAFWATADAEVVGGTRRYLDTFWNENNREGVHALSPTAQALKRHLNAWIYEVDGFCIMCVGPHDHCSCETSDIKALSS